MHMESPLSLSRYENKEKNKKYHIRPPPRVERVIVVHRLVACGGMRWKGGGKEGERGQINISIQVGRWLKRVSIATFFVI